MLSPLATKLTQLTLAGLALSLSGCLFVPFRADPHSNVAFAGRVSDTNLSFTQISNGRPIAPSDLTPTSRAYTVGPGDVLKISIAEIADTESTTMVMPDGRLYYDAASGVHAVNKTIPELESELESSLADYYAEPVVTINAVQVKSQNYTIMGQIATPGVYPLVGPTTVLDAVSYAGGIRSSEIGSRTQNLADMGRAVLLRNGRVVHVNFERLIEHGDMSQNIYLQPKDYIYLPAKGTQKVYVLGNAARPRTVPYASDLTFIKALASAGGPGPSTYRNGILLIRNATSPESEVAAISLPEILNGKATDFYLEPGDVIWLPRAPWQKLMDYATVAVDSAVSTIAIQEAADSGGGSISATSFSGNTITLDSSDVTLDVSTGPAAEDGTTSTTITVTE